MKWLDGKVNILLDFGGVYSPHIVKVYFIDIVKRYRQAKETNCIK